MSKKRKKDPQVERPTFFGSIAEHPLKVTRGGVKGAGVGALAGAGVSVTLGTPLALSTGLGAAGGAMFGATDAALDAHDLEVTIYNRGEAVMDTLEERLENAETRLIQAGQGGVASELKLFRKELSSLFKGEEESKKKTKRSDENDENDENDEDEAPKRKGQQRKGQGQRQQPNA